MKITIGPNVIVINQNGDAAMLESNLKDDTQKHDTEFRAAVDGMESLLLALFTEGIISDDNEEAVTRAVTTTLDAIAFNT